MDEVQPQSLNTAEQAKLPTDRTPAETSLDETLKQCKRAGRAEDAIAVIEAALLDDPANGRLHWRLGEVYRETKRFREAKEVFERALLAAPKLPELRLGLAMVCQEMKQQDEAVRHYEELVLLRPNNAADWNNLGISHSDKRSFERATECYKKAIEIDPKYAFAWNNLGNALGYDGRYAESIAAFDAAIALKPDYAEAYNNRAVTRTQVEDHDAAIEDYARALHFKAEYAEAHTNRSLLLLLLGQYQAGWTEYEWRWKNKDGKDRRFGGQRWDGGPLAGKRILIYSEQGLGDTIQFIRYARELKAKGATVYVECQRPLCKLLSRSAGVDRMFHRGQELPPIDYHVPMLSIPALMGVANIPSAAPYVIPHPGMTEKWAERLSRYSTTFNIGIAWQGNPQHRGDRKRSIPLKQFAPLARIPGVRLFSLQKGFGVEQITVAAQEVPLTDLGNVGVTEDGFLRTAAIVKNLDLVITADTSVAHLAGAMGVPVWIAMSTACDWRWQLKREDSDWYPSMRLFRQREPGNWDEVFERIAEKVKRLIAGRCVRSSPSPDAKRRAKSLCDEATKLLVNKEPSKAEPLLQEATELDPSNLVAHHDLGLSRLRQQRHQDAATSFRRVLELEPQHAHASANLGAALMHLRQHDDAIKYLRDAIRLGSGSPAVHNNLGAALAQLGDHAAAETEYHTAMRLRPDYPGAHYNLSHALFAQGRLEEAWVEHEWRWRMPGASRRRFKQPKWGGERLDGRTVLLYAEHSIEDTILFARFAAMAKDRGGRVILECRVDAVAVLKTCPFIDEVAEAGAPLPAFDVQLPLLSVPGLTLVKAGQIPTPIPYLNGDVVSNAADCISHIKGYRIGVASRGTGEYPGDSRHNIPPSLITALATIAHVQLIDVQIPDPGWRMTGADENYTKLIRVLKEGDGLADVARLVKAVDMVVSADNAVAHIAGASGANVWTNLSAVPHWRWMSAGAHTPWYPQMRLISAMPSADQQRQMLTHVAHATQ